jgi:hypothetical protein
MMNLSRKARLILTGALFLACTSAPPAPAVPADQLDAAVRETSDYLNKQLPKGNKLVILNIQSDFPALSEYIIDELIANTVNDQIFSVVDRRQLDTIRAELDFQMSGEVDDETAQALGRMAGAHIIVSGAVSQIGNLYRLRVRALSVQSAEIEGQFNRNIPDNATIAALVKSRATGYGAGGGNYGGSGGGTAAASSGQEASAKSAPVSAPAPVPAQAEPVQRNPNAPYKIGETGPAGGIVFYDKGYSSDGWQYLEAAARDAPTAHWSDDRIEGTRAGIGNGKQNTELITRTGEAGTAAQRCREYRQGGCDDWFLPSKDELNLMYEHLKKKGLGGFSNTEYWTSSGEGHGAWYQQFRNGVQEAGKYNSNTRTATYAVRAIRQF